MRVRTLAAAVALAALSVTASAQNLDWNDIVAKARGQTVNFNAWAGDEKSNAFIQWAAQEVGRRYGVTLVHVSSRTRPRR